MPAHNLLESEHSLCYSSQVCTLARQVNTGVIDVMMTKVWEYGLDPLSNPCAQGRELWQDIEEAHGS